MTHLTWDPEDYERHSAQQQTWARDLLAKLELLGNEDVLDVGCGDGKVTAEIAARVPDGRVVGVDLSPAMVERANALHACRHPNLRFEVGDASSLRFDREFSVVFSNAALHWIRNHRPVLSGISRSLRRDGRVLLQMGGRGNAAEVVSVIDEVITQPEWSGYFVDFGLPYGFHSPAEYEVWLREASLKPIRVELLPKDMLHEGREGLAGWLRTTWLPYLQRVPEDRRHELLEAILDSYLARHPVDEAGNSHVRMVRLEVEARKMNESGLPER
ncbi:MAG TPA: methyltransferase domain-containing protein [Acidimicrobiales bacterium]|nr:methyltransferase domain-containing protein [Acidimicrobiales bacterium]